MPFGKRCLQTAMIHRKFNERTTFQTFPVWQVPISKTPTAL